MGRGPHANSRTRGRLWCALGLALGLSGPSVPAATAAMAPSAASADPGATAEPDAAVPVTVESEATTPDARDPAAVATRAEEATTEGATVDDGILRYRCTHYPNMWS